MINEEVWTQREASWPLVLESAFVASSGVSDHAHGPWRTSTASTSFENGAVVHQRPG